MPRKNILEVTEEIIKVLKKDGESSIKHVSDKIGSQWRTSLKSLEFLNKLGIVKEKKGKKTNKEERLFSLVESKKGYGKNNASF